jgi:hypothetical protein
MPEAIAMKAATEPERVMLRAILKRGDQQYTECPCGWFYSGARCPDKGCKEWKKANGTKRVKLYAHVDKESNYDKGRELGLDEAAMRNFAYWGGEIEFDAEIDVETGKVRLLAVDGHKISPAKG